MLAGDEARRLGAALATAVELEWLADIRARLRERLQAARGEGGARQRSGRAVGELCFNPCRVFKCAATV